MKPLRMLAILLAVIMIITPFQPTVKVMAAAGTDDQIYQGLNSLNLQIDKEKRDSFTGVHPRLLLNSKKLSEIKTEVEKPGRMKDAYEKLIRQADSAITVKVPTEDETKGYMPDAVSSTSTDFVPTLALAYIITHEEKYLKTTIAWLNALCRYPKWQTTPDLFTGNGLLTLGITYDWLHQYLPEDVKSKVRAKIKQEGGIVYEKVTLDRQSYWNREWLQNHNWICVMGMAVSAMAIFDEDDTAKLWIEAANKNFSTTASVLPKDGGNHEGVDYWFYGMESIFVYSVMARDLLGVDMISTQWFEKATDFLIYNFFPRNSWGPKYGYYFAFGDNTGTGTLLEHMLRLLAREYKNGYAQWLADELIEAGTSSRHAYFTLLWYDGSVASVSPLEGSKPLMKHFDDLDFVVSRSGWDGNESALNFHCGPPMGHNENKLSKTVSPYYDWGGGHVDPESNSFLLFGNGELLIRGDDYASTKYTRQLNSLTIDNQGQAGEGGSWFSTTRYHAANADAHIQKVESIGELDHMIGDATKAYLPNSNVKKFKRHLMYLKPDILIVVDDIELSQAHSMELRFWPEKQDFWPQHDGSYLVPGDTANMKFQPLTLDRTNLSVETSELVTRYYTAERKGFKLQKNGTVWRNAVAITWSNSMDTPKTVQFDQMGSIWRFKTDGQYITLDFDTEKVSLEGKNDYQNQNIKLLVNDKTVSTDVYATIVDGATMLPIRDVFNKLGTDIEWNGQNGEVKYRNKNKSTTLTVGNKLAVVDGKTVEMDAAPFEENDRVYIPARIISESLGAKVEWDSNTQTIKITSSGKYPGTNANISGILVKGKKLDGFTPEKINYSYSVVGSSDVPPIVPFLEDANANATVIPAKSVPGQTVIKVVSADGTKQKEYVIDLKKEYYKGLGILGIVDAKSSDSDNPTTLNAIDNDVGTAYSSEGVGSWLELDMGQVQKVNSIAMSFPSGTKRIAFFAVELSNDRENWKQVYDGKSSGKTLEPQHFSFELQQARYVRIIGKGNSASAWNSYYDVGLFDDRLYIKDFSMTVDQPNPKKGDILNPLITIKMSDGSEFTDKDKVTLVSSDPKIAVVNSDNKIEVLDSGTVKITASIDVEGNKQSVQTEMIISDGTNKILPSDDSYITKWRTSENYASAGYIEARNAVSNSGNTREGFMKFDLSSVKGNIKSAELCFFAGSKTAETKVSNVDVDIYSIFDDKWNEKTLLPNNKPPLEEILGSAKVNDTMNWYAVDVTEYVQTHLKKNKSVSFGFKAKTPEGYVTIRTKEATSANQRPYLKITTQ